MLENVQRKKETTLRGNWLQGSVSRKTIPPSSVLHQAKTIKRQLPEMDQRVPLSPNRLFISLSFSIQAMEKYDYWKK